MSECLNSKNVSDTERMRDKITEISFFSHGLSANRGTITLGYDYSEEYNRDLDINNISEINSESFEENLNSNFHSCNIGTVRDGSFAQKWVNEFGGITTAFKWKTDYAKVPDNSLVVKIVRKITQMILGVSVLGGDSDFPIAGEAAEQVIFIGNNCIDLIKW